MAASAVPLPLDSFSLGHPPLWDTPGVTGRSALMPDRGAVLRGREDRQCPRRPLRCELELLDEGTAPGGRSRRIPAESLNISDNGMYGMTRVGYGISNGQRYLFRLRVGERGPEPGLLQIVHQEGVILRTELLLGDDGQDRVGFAVRWSGRRSGVIPMPV